MRRVAGRAAVAVVVLLALYAISGCDGGIIGDPPPSSSSFEGCFQGQDENRVRIVLTLESHRTAAGVATAALSGCLFYIEDQQPQVRQTFTLDGKVEDGDQFRATLNAIPGEFEVVVRLDEGDTADPADDTVTVEVPGIDPMGPLDKRGPPPEEMCPTSCP